MRHCETRQAIDARENQLVAIFPLGISQRQRIAFRRMPGIVDHRVKTPPAIEGSTNEMLKVSGISDGAAHGERAKLSRDRVDALRARHQGELPATRRETARDGGADALARRGYERDRHAAMA